MFAKPLAHSLAIVIPGESMKASSHVGCPPHPRSFICSVSLDYQTNFEFQSHFRPRKLSQRGSLHNLRSNSSEELK